jgi:GT2 family glycosyltransferase
MFEVVVVDDGSPEPLDVLEFSNTLAIRLVRQENCGPATARNHGVRMASGKIVVFIGDDIQVAENFVEQHLAWHTRQDDIFDAMLGKVDWLSGHLATHYTRWLDSSGLQFGYHGLKDRDSLSYYHFYTSNISVKRELLLEHPFDEDFRFAAFEDSELGIRLMDVGIRLRFHPAAMAWHDHLYDLESSCEHRYRVGQAARVFARKQPTYARFKWIRRLPGPLRAIVSSSAYRRIAEFAADRGDLTLIGAYYYHRNSEAFWAGYADSGE